MVGDGFKVHNYIPGRTGGFQRMDPFLMLDYNAPWVIGPRNKPLGVGVHPHRGFETVTIAYQGKVAHHDSAGNSGVIGEGEVQWMTAASGILHKEYHEKEFSKKGGTFQMVQLWVNLPAQHKMSPPKYQGITRDQIARKKLADNMGEVEIIAGEFEGVKGPAYTFSPVALMNAKLKAKASTAFTFPAHYNTALVVISGEITVNGQKATSNQFVLMGNDGQNFTLTATTDAIVLVISGEPLREPIAAHGPFVMNTRQQLIEAFNDFQSGKFGDLED
jgi:redox-sensitive bicupin YhaK (pirin superfamily)